ncbi:uncharacterized protein STEHIDRAFT_157871 [Stereum hirsutum FP-91666 SS1]|uniref:uncharacterized protein n=1 Tax=Stereum hirsutum (strain FP-91666) TaxID=721885 RepID=UPI000444A264|nr:uncharacterized protein STEHIDRAFT_157871 [Stereum hirsutum FP-91666 SS1]EIM85223.1 hypothetical protein STEHIDRAFT_157871 [Stereum hirsutum FP-91666 SS1]
MSDSKEELITNATQGFLEMCCIVSAAVIWMMDYIQTLPIEVNVIWRRKWTGSSVLFAVNRYGYLIALAFELFLYLPGVTTGRWCSSAGHLQIVFFSLTTATSAALLSLRLYGIYGRSRIVLLATTALILSRAFCDIWQTVNAEYTSNIGTPLQQIDRCLIEVKNFKVLDMCRSHTKDNAVNTVIPTLGITFDIFLFALTVRKTRDQAKAMKDLGRVSIAHALLDDGFFHFLTVGVLGAVYSISNIVPLIKPNSPGARSFAYLNPYYSA